MSYYGCSLATILRACPNLRNLFLGRLEAPYSSEGVDGSRLKRIKLGFFDVSTLEQLRNLNLSLIHFHGFFTLDRREIIDINNKETMLSLIQLLGRFLETQAPTLQSLELFNQGRLVLSNTTSSSDLFPCPLPNLTELKIYMTLVSDLNQILAGVPELDVLRLTGKEVSISSCLPTRIIKDHLAITKLQVHTLTQPHELAQLGCAFQSLSTLDLHEVPHGHLFVVYTELAQLNVLKIHERGSDFCLHDEDFIGTHYPRSPYIGRMKNLHKLEITFGFKVGGASTPFITDLILSQGIFDIVTQLDKLTISGARFSDEALEELESFMKPFWNYTQTGKLSYSYARR